MASQSIAAIVLVSSVYACAPAAKPEIAPRALPGDSTTPPADPTSAEPSSEKAACDKRYGPSRDQPDPPARVRALGGCYESIGFIGDATRVYEAYAQRFPEEPDAAALLTKAVCFRLSFGDNNAAKEDAALLLTIQRQDKTLAELCPNEL